MWRARKATEPLARRLPGGAASPPSSPRRLSMRKLAFSLTVAAATVLGACSKTGDGQYQVKTPAVSVGTNTTTVTTPTVGTKTDTINTPVVGTKKDTLVVDRPVVGTKKTEVKVPTVNPPKNP
ncbi:hypothetical protein tb265_01260 [Gemmatimonadetes bacterium T265]|nr:hypothetical protein tb265_01260 [Gemmatimonadetes bacterium T265]